MDSNVETTNIYSHPELLVVADTVAREKGIDREEVLEAMEQAIQKPVDPNMAMNMIFGLKLTVILVR